MPVMSVAEREEFLTGLHVGVLGVAGPAGQAPYTVPVWYSYQPGGQVTVITGRKSRKGQAILDTGRMSLCAQDENPPYRYVSVEGPVIAGELDPADWVAMAHRYLGPEHGDAFVANNPPPDGGSMILRMAPERWLTGNFSDH